MLPLYKRKFASQSKTLAVNLSIGVVMRDTNSLLKACSVKKEYVQNLRKTNNQSADITMEGAVWNPYLEVSVWRSNSLAPKIIVGGQLLCQGWILYNPLDVPLDDVVRQVRHPLSQPGLPETDMILLTSHFLTSSIKMGDSARPIRIHQKENIYWEGRVPHKARPSLGK